MVSDSITKPTDRMSLGISFIMYGFLDSVTFELCGGRPPNIRTDLQRLLIVTAVIEVFFT